LSATRYAMRSIHDFAGKGTVARVADTRLEAVLAGHVSC